MVWNTSCLDRSQLLLLLSSLFSFLHPLLLYCGTSVFFLPSAICVSVMLSPFKGHCWNIPIRGGIWRKKPSICEIMVRAECRRVVQIFGIFNGLHLFHPVCARAHSHSQAKHKQRSWRRTPTVSLPRRSFINSICTSGCPDLTSLETAEWHVPIEFGHAEL